MGIIVLSVFRELAISFNRKPKHLTGMDRIVQGKSVIAFPQRTK